MKSDTNQSEMITISVAICSVSHPSEISQTLHSILSAAEAANKLLLGEVNVSLLYIFNGPEDSFYSTKEYLSRYFAKCSRIICQAFFSSSFNLSLARNVALNESRSPFLIFLDDDVILDIGYFSSYVKSLDFLNGSHIALAGGMIQLSGAEGLSQLHRSFLSELNYGEETILLENGFVNGANLIIDVGAAIEIGGFDSHLGRHGGLLLSGEESDLILRLRRADHKIGYVGGMKVKKIVEEERRQRSWLAKRVAWEAVTRGIIELKSPENLTVIDGAMHLSDEKLTRFLIDFQNLLIRGMPIRQSAQFYLRCRWFIAHLTKPLRNKIRPRL